MTNENKHSRFFKKYCKVNALSELKTNIDAKKAVVEAKYQQGLISELEYRIQIYDLDKQLYDIDSSNVAYQNSKALMDMINAGVYMK